MKKLYIVMMLVLTGTMAIAQTSVWHGGRQMWTRGEGTESNPFLIESAENLAYLAYAVNKGYDMLGVHFLLTTDIDLNGSEDQQWVPIGLGNKYGYSEDGCDRGNPSTYGTFYPYAYFKGHFDGGEHSISNIYIDNENSYSGLFGNVQRAAIEDVFVTNGYIRGSCCGGIAGQTSDSVSISRCWSGVTLEGFGTGFLACCGGIVGYNSFSVLNIQKCYNIGPVGAYCAGGIVGGGKGIEIEECYNKGDITGTYAGGIFGGTMGGNITISDFYNTGNITANTDYGTAQTNAPAGPAAGGIAGAKLMSSGSVTITNGYNVGNVSSTRNMGCIMAFSAGNTIFEFIYYLNTCNDEIEGCGIPLAEDYMRSQAFVDQLNGRNRDQVWAFDVDNINDGFPILSETNYLAVSERPEPAFNVYPNPAQGRFTVEGTGCMTVSNLLGQIVLVKEIDGQTTVALPQGMYFLKLGNETRKIVVE